MCLWFIFFASVLTGFAEENVIRLRIVHARGNAIGQAVATATGPDDEAALTGRPTRGPFRPAHHEIKVFLYPDRSAPIDITEPPLVEPTTSPIPAALAATPGGWGLLLLDVVDTESAAISRARIEVRGPGGLLMQTLTRDEGDAVLSGVPIRVPLTLVVTAAGFARWHAEVTLYTECERTVKLEVRNNLEGTKVHAHPPPDEPRPTRGPWWRRLWR